MNIDRDAPLTSSIKPLKMATIRRKFTEEEKHTIIELAKQSTISKVLRDYHLSYSVFSRWKQQLDKSSPGNPPEDVSKLRNENVLLKKIVAELTLELQIQKENAHRKD